MMRSPEGGAMRTPRAAARGAGGRTIGRARIRGARVAAMAQGHEHKLESGSWRAVRRSRAVSGEGGVRFARLATRARRARTREAIARSAGRGVLPITPDQPAADRRQSQVFARGTQRPTGGGRRRQSDGRFSVAYRDRPAAGELLLAMIGLAKLREATIFFH